MNALAGLDRGDCPLCEGLGKIQFLLTKVLEFTRSWWLHISSHLENGFQFVEGSFDPFAGPP